MRIESVSVSPAIETRDCAKNPAIPKETNSRSSAQPASAALSSESSLKMTRETDDGQNTVYRLVDNRTGTIISQVPSQQVLNVESSIEQLLQQEIQKPKLDVKS
jgi:uncharacterized FlaG/YvyC family protein